MTKYQYLKLLIGTMLHTGNIVLLLPEIVDAGIIMPL